jgi:hypothetical protein
MAVGAIFLLLLAIIAFILLGFGLYVLLMRLRARQLDPSGDRVEGDGRPGTGEREGRPEHVRQGRPQRARFLPHR